MYGNHSGYAPLRASFEWRAYDLSGYGDLDRLTDALGRGLRSSESGEDTAREDATVKHGLSRVTESARRFVSNSKRGMFMHTTTSSRHRRLPLLAYVALAALLVGIAASFATRSVDAAETMTITTKDSHNGATGTEVCAEDRDEKSNEWHWVITQAGGGIAPASIEVTFLYAGTVTVPVDNVTPGGLAHYYYFGFLGDTHVVATTEIDESWSGQFNLSHYPCGQEPPQTVLSVVKTAETSYDETCEWSIDKSSPTANLDLATGQVMPVAYSVVVDAECGNFSNFAVSGTITVQNSGEYPATGIIVEDVMTINGDETFVTVNCPAIPSPLAPLASFQCTYSTSVDGLDGGTNIALVTADPVVPTHEDALFESEPVPFTFGAPTNLLDECVSVTDDQYGDLGGVCASDAPQTFTYTLQVVYQVCGAYSFVNTASFVTGDSGATGSDSHTVIIDVPCGGGCTLTQGYWKTHSLLGPAPYDDAWLAIGPLGAATPFFSSGKTWYQVLWTPPSGGNVYLQLAHQYIAAKLNILNGASTTPAVNAAIAYAEAFFPGKTPATSLTNAVKNTVRGHASTLDKYNNGLIGPGHCSE